MKLTLQRGLIALALIFWGLAQGAVYRYVDEEGNITFTSEPPPGTRISPVEVPEPNTVNSPKPRPAPGEGTDSTSSTDRYSSISIAQPQDGTTIRSNAGNITVTVNVGPTLRPSDSVVLYLDGTEVARGAGTVFALERIDRGTHQLSAAIKDPKGKTLIKSSSISFNLLRISALTSPGRTPRAP